MCFSRLTTGCSAARAGTKTRYASRQRTRYPGTGSWRNDATGKDERRGLRASRPRDSPAGTGFRRPGPISPPLSGGYRRLHPRPPSLAGGNNDRRDHGGGQSSLESTRTEVTSTPPYPAEFVRVAREGRYGISGPRNHSPICRPSWPAATLQNLVMSTPIMEVRVQIVRFVVVRAINQHF